jgi:hypothetical protein
MGPEGFGIKKFKKIDSMQLEGGPGGMQPMIQMNPKESSMVELFYLKFDCSIIL